MNPQMESVQVPSRINRDKSPLRHSLVKLQDIKDKIVKAIKERERKRKREITYKTVFLKHTH